MKRKATDIDLVISETKRIQKVLSDYTPLLVGGLAAYVHCKHRYSLDADFVLKNLSENYDEIRGKLELLEGWKSARLKKPVIILGERHSVEIGIRQIFRKTRLDMELMEGILLPTIGECLRIKTYMCAVRNAVRDYIDVAALSDKLGKTASLEALASLNKCYDPIGNQSPLAVFAENCTGYPEDFDSDNLKNYKGIRQPYDDWHYVSKQCLDLSIKALLRKRTFTWEMRRRNECI